MELGDYLYQMGDLDRSLQFYSRSREFVTCTKQMMDMHLAILKVCLEQGNFPSVLATVSRIQANTFIDTPSHLPSLLHAFSGIACLSCHRFKEAANHFLQIQLDHLPQLTDILSPHDVVLYSVMTILATFQRTDYKKKVVSNPSFQQLLELEPFLRDMIESFFRGKYAPCLEHLAQIQVIFYSFMVRMIWNWIFIYISI
jgi:COP9 signalosome complex subunit 1